MTYQVPVEDVRFVLGALAGLDEVLALPRHAGLDRETVDAVLVENARFVEAVVAPLNRVADLQPARWDEGEVHTSPGFREAFRQFSEGGWQSLPHDDTWGGQGLPRLLAAAADEALNAANLSFALCPMLTNGVIEALSLAGSPEQCEQYLAPLLEGRWTGTMNLTEPQAGSDLAQLTAKALPQADGTYRIFGQKIFITYGDHDLAENIIHLVLARTPDAPRGVKGISLFIVPKFLVNEDGSVGPRNDVWCASLEHKLGIHGSPTAVLMYGAGKGEVGEGAVAYRVGEENRGLQYMFIMMNAARFAVGIQGVAQSERALQLAEAYAAERLQGQALEGSAGPVTIDQHPDVQRMLLTMRALTEAARATALYAAAQADFAHAHDDPDVRQRARARYEYLVPVVKAFSTEVAVEVASLGVQVHGGMGFIEETGAAQYYRDARILPIYEGTTAIQANDFLGRKVLRDDGAVAFASIENMRETVARLRAGADAGAVRGAALLMIADRLDEAVSAYAAALRYVLDTRELSLRSVFLGSVPLLMLAGLVEGGWQLARAAIACERVREEGRFDRFHERKFATSVFYAAHLLPRAKAYADSIVAGSVVSSYASSVYAK